jgi:HNH endonuclease
VRQQGVSRGSRTDAIPVGQLSAEVVKKIIAKHENHCAVCDADGSVTPLVVALLQAQRDGGQLTEDNLALLCANCHAGFDRGAMEVEFTNFLAGLLRDRPDFKIEGIDQRIGRDVHYRADILAARLKGGEPESLLIECKRSPASMGRIHSVIATILAYREAYRPSQAVLAIPATLQEADRKQLFANQIELWDLDFIAATFKDQIAAAPMSYYKLLCQARSGRSPQKTTEQKLLEKLRAIKPGLKDWSVYQSLIGEILEHLFCPTLVKPISELSDATRTNRRDFILPNYSKEGFWAFLRERYAADYVVVDAKNYTGKLNKSHVLQIANYLKEHGAGLFGMIFSRKGGDSGGCQVTLREQWAVHQKMILILTDDDVERMLLAKSDDRDPEEVIGTIIEEFRLSL